MLPIRGVVLAVVIVVVASLTASPANAATGGGNNQEIDVAAFSFGYHGAPNGSVNPGHMTIRLRNVSREDDHEFVVFKLAPSHAKDSIKTLIREIDNAFATFDFSFVDLSVPPGGVAPVPPGRSSTGFADLIKTGTYFYVCFVQEPDGTPHYHLGMLGKFKVTGQ